MADYYETNAADYAAIEPEAEWRKQLVDFAKILKPGCRVLDLGCGPAHDSQWLIENGFDVVSMDGSSAMAREAKQRYGINVEVRLIEDIDYRNEFDAVWASGSIHHVRRENIPSAIALVANAMKPGGWFYSNYKVFDEDVVDGLGRYYAAITEAELLSALESAGLAVKETTIVAGMGADGKPANFICATASKSAY